MLNKSDTRRILKSITQAVTAAEFYDADRLIAEFKKSQLHIDTHFGATERTLIHYAASNKDAKVTQAIIELKANVNVIDRSGATPLHLASLNGLTEVVKILLQNDANVQKADYAGFTPLHYATERGHYEIAECLLAKNADPNAVILEDDYLEYYEATSLHIAASHGRQDLIVLLLANGAEPTILDRDGQTAGDIFDKRYDNNGVSFQDLISKAEIQRITKEPKAAILEQNVKKSEQLEDDGNITHKKLGNDASASHLRNPNPIINENKATNDNNITPEVIIPADDPKAPENALEASLPPKTRQLPPINREQQQCIEPLYVNPLSPQPNYHVYTLLHSVPPQSYTPPPNIHYQQPLVLIPRHQSSVISQGIPHMRAASSLG
jgi:ankyrin repeat protein